MRAQATATTRASRRSAASSSASSSCRPLYGAWRSALAFAIGVAYELHLHLQCHDVPRSQFMFATFIPELSVLLSSWQLQRRYRSRFGERHVLVCGELTYRTIKKFVRHLFDNKHEPNSRDVFVVFLGECASLLTSRLVSSRSLHASPLLSSRTAHT